MNVCLYVFKGNRKRKIIEEKRDKCFRFSKENYDKN